MKCVSRFSSSPPLENTNVPPPYQDALHALPVGLYGLPCMALSLIFIRGLKLFTNRRRSRYTFNAELWPTTKMIMAMFHFLGSVYQWKQCLVGDCATPDV